MAARVALVTGANGFVGAHVVRALIREGAATRALVRENADLRSLEEKFPGLEYVHLSKSMGTPRDAMLEQIARLGKEVMPKFTARAA